METQTPYSLDLNQAKSTVVSNSSSGKTSVFLYVIIVIIVILITGFILYNKNLKIVIKTINNFLNKLFLYEKPIEKPINEKPKPIKKNEVFNIDNNDFTYKEAQLLCEALGCKLATYGQLIDAYNNGANWCNYGWSADGLALFPIQPKFYDQIQNDSQLKNKCGKPGINGGFFKNKNLKFGVNCYGPKPDPIDSRIVYSSDNSCNVDKRIIDEYEKRLKSGDIDVRSFNRNKWSDFSKKESAYIIPPKKNYNILDRDIELAISLN